MIKKVIPIKKYVDGQFIDSQKTLYEISINKVIKNNKDIKIDKDLIYVFNHLKNIDNVLKKNKKLLDKEVRLKSYVGGSLERNKPKYTIEIIIRFNDNCTIGYCKDYIVYLFKYANMFNFKIESDYDNTIDFNRILLSY